MYISAEIFQKWNCFYENYAKTYEVRIAYNKKLNRNSNCQCQIQIEAKLPSINFFSSYSKDIKHNALLPPWCYYKICQENPITISKSHLQDKLKFVVNYVRENNNSDTLTICQGNPSW